jgi:hypothetical protein
MNDHGGSDGVRLSGAQRRLLAALGLGLILILVIAATLKPDPRGYGTHRQLGWPPCGTRMLLGIRCPSCGMTTSWAHLVRGHLRSALRANVAGALLGLAAIAAVPWLFLSAARGRWLWRGPSPMVAAFGAAGVIGVAILDWFVRLLID